MNATNTFPFPRIGAEAGLDIYAAASENNGRPPLLLMHGFLSSRAQWLPNLGGMQTFCRPVIAEHFAHGRTSAPEDLADCSLSSLIDQLEKLRAFLELETWTLCGHSMGGAICLNYALIHPERVNAVIFSNAVSAFMDPNIDDMSRNVDAFAKQIEDGGLEFLESTPFHPSRMKNIDLGVREALVADAKNVDPKGIARALRGTNTHISVRDKIRDLKTPTLLINGVRESSFQPDRSWAEQNVPNLTVVDFEEGGHNVNAELPQRFNDTVAKFLAANTE